MIQYDINTHDIWDRHLTQRYLTQRYSTQRYSTKSRVNLFISVQLLLPTILIITLRKLYNIIALDKLNHEIAQTQNLRKDNRIT